MAELPDGFGKPSKALYFCVVIPWVNWRPKHSLFTCQLDVTIFGNKSVLKKHTWENGDG